MRVSRVIVAFIVLLGVLAIVKAQASIAGQVKDASGAVLPGVTVEASSPALIEKSAVGCHRRHRPMPDRAAAARDLRRDVRVARASAR